MEIRLGQSLTIKQEQKVEQKIQVEQKISLRQALELAISLREIHREVDGSDEDRMKSSLDQLFAMMGKDLQPEQVEMMRERLKGLVYNEGAFIELVLKNSHTILFDGLSGIKKLTTDIVARNLAFSGSQELAGFTEGEIAYAFSDPLKTSRQITEYQALMATMEKSETERISTELNKLVRLKSFYDQLAPVFEDIQIYLQTVLNYPNISANPVRRSMVDVYMLDKASYLVSERLVKRFAATFSRAKKDITYDKLKTGAGNIIGEYILVGMGIIDPEIFKCMSGVAKEDPNDEILLNNGEREKIGVLKEKYNLSSGKFFYNRYATLAMRPNQQTDNIIRDFLINNVRGLVNDELCEAIDLREMINQFLENFEESGRETARDSLMSDIFNALGSIKFKQTVTEIIKQKLLPEMIKMLSGKRATAPMLFKP